jgi:hypothetical protein
MLTLILSAHRTTELQQSISLAIYLESLGSRRLMRFQSWKNRRNELFLHRKTPAVTAYFRYELWLLIGLAVKY